MEKLLCKLMAVVMSLGLAVSAQANLIVSDHSVYNSAAKGGGHYFSSDKVSGWQDINEDLSPRFSSIVAPAKDASFAYEARGFDREIFNLGPDASSRAGNSIDRVKINTLVPESTSLMLFAIGLFSLVMARRKMKA